MGSSWVSVAQLPLTASTYLLCTAPRSGSTMLCRMLAATSVAGDPQSYFHRPDVSSWASGLNLPKDATLSEILNAVTATATGGMTGIRVQQHSFPFLMNTLRDYGTTDPERIKTAFGPTIFIWLRRTDKVAQAVSLLRAQHTGLWHRNSDGSDLERLPPVQTQGYDAAAITAQIRDFEAADQTWQRWFEGHNITPWSLTYEALAERPQLALRDILLHLGRDGDIADKVDIQTAKLADATSANWIARYRADALAPQGQTG